MEFKIVTFQTNLLIDEILTGDICLCQSKRENTSIEEMTKDPTRKDWWWY